MRERGARGEVGKEGNGRAGGSAERVRQRFQRDSGADGPQQVAGEAQVQDFGEEVLNKYLHYNGFNHLTRAHQLCT